MSDVQPENFVLPQRRPASHRWAITLLACISVAFVGPLLQTYKANNAFNIWQRPLMAAFYFLAFVTLVSLLTGGSRRWAYYAGVISLGLLSVRGLQSAYYALSPGSPWNPSLEYVRIPVVILAGLIVLLFHRFSFGKASRRYFGFVAASEYAKSPPD